VHKRLEGRLKLEPRQLAGNAGVVGHDLGQCGPDLRALHDDAVGLELLAAVVALLVAHDDGELGRLLVLGRLLDIIGVLVDPGPVPVVVRSTLVDVLGLAHRPHHDLGFVLVVAVLGLVVALLLLVCLAVVLLVIALLAVLLVVLGLLLLFLLLGLGVGVESGGAGPALRQLPRLCGAPRFLVGAGAE
jgi:hypothetical protein